jgi:exonuclease III
MTILKAGKMNEMLKTQLQIIALQELRLQRKYTNGTHSQEDKYEGPSPDGKT